MRHTMLRLTCLAGAIAIVPVVASAQLGGGIVLTPYVGLYAPANDIAKIDVSSPSLGGRLSAKHQSAAAFGATASYWLTDRFSFEVGGAYTASGLRSSTAVSDPAGIPTTSETEHAHLWLGAAS